MPGDPHVLAAALLRQDGQRYTASRRELVEVLGDAGAPLTIPELLVRRPRLAQSSAYRNLAVLERAGVVARVVTTGEWVRYELSEALSGHHHHVICSTCGAVADVEVEDELERDLALAVERLAGRTGFQIDSHRLDLVGTCASCS